MSLIWTDGFDLCSTVSSAPPTRWSVTSGSVFSGTTSSDMQTGRTGSGKLWHMRQGNSSGYGADTSLGTSYGPTLILGFAWKFLTNGVQGQSIINLMDGQVYQMGLRHDSSMRLCVIRNNSVLATETNVVMTTGQWYYLELKVVLAGSSSGSYAVRRNGTVVAGLADTSSVTTITSANTSASAIRIGRVMDGINPPEMYFDDMTLSPDAFQGDVRVIGNLPNAVGTTSGLTKVGGSTGNYTATNEATADNDTSYVTSSVVGTYDTYNYPTLPSNAATVIGVMGTPNARKDDIGGRSVTTRVRLGASEADAPTPSSLALAYTTLQQPMDINPVTSSAWTVSDLNSSEFGPKVAA